MSLQAMPSSPAILLCNSCSTIISDTHELRGEAADLGAYVVNGVENATVDSVQQQAHLPSGSIRYVEVKRGDKDCCCKDVWHMRTYNSVLCGNCGTAVGRCYEDMEEGLQHLECYFLLDAASIRRWQLGSCKQRAPAAAQAASGEGASLAQQQQQRIEQLEDSVLKVQHLMCFHSQRLDSIDARLAAADRPLATPNGNLQ